MEKQKEKNSLQTLLDLLPDGSRELSFDPPSDDRLESLYHLVREYKQEKFDAKQLKINVYYAFPKGYISNELSKGGHVPSSELTDLEGKGSWLNGEVVKLYESNIKVEPDSIHNVSIKKASIDCYEDDKTIVIIHCDVEVTRKENEDDYVYPDPSAEDIEQAEEEERIRQYQEAYENRFDKMSYNPDVPHIANYDALLDVLGFFEQLYHCRQQPLLLLSRLSLPLHVLLEEPNRLNELTGKNHTAVALVDISPLKPLMVVNQSLNPQSQVHKAYSMLYLFHEVNQRRLSLSKEKDIVIGLDRKGNVISAFNVEDLLDSESASLFSDYVINKYLI